MGELFQTIRSMVLKRRYLIGEHAALRLEERGILEWQAVVGMEDGHLIRERTGARPNPIVEVVESLPNGVEFKAVWSLLPASQVAKLVTVHFFDEGEP